MLLFSAPPTDRISNGKPLIFCNLAEKSTPLGHRTEQVLIFWIRIFELG